ncbi:MAG: carboxypeptidase-like regulatory domain-containing protein, partial [Cellulophaga sp.]|nr:carboxypeptidase-like regulatory domain-containing protein [Cellulophaga sp.]
MKTLLSTLLLFVVTFSYAQIKFEGVVTDSLNAPLELANVVAINKETSGLESYGITDGLGKFKLQLGKNGTYIIKISYVGMGSIDEEITTKEVDIIK